MDQNQLKLAVANAAVDYSLTRIDQCSVIGIGTGSTANFFIDAIAAHRHKFAGTVASSSASEERLKALDIPVLELNSVAEITVYIDGADEIDPQL